MKLTTRHVHSFTIKRPFPLIDENLKLIDHAVDWPIRVRLYECNEDIARRLNEREGDPKFCEPSSGYYSSREYLRDGKNLYGEIGLSIAALTPGLVAHESLHATCDAYGLMHVSKLEEPYARALHSLTDTIWRRLPPTIALKQRRTVAVRGYA